MSGMLGKEALHRNPRLLVAGESPFNHRFGGPIGELAPDLARAPIHVLYSLDLRDPLLGFLGMEGTSLPLIFPLTVDGGTISYMCGKDGGIKLLGRTPGPREPDWPYPNYPIVFAKTPIQVREFSYEEYRAAVFRYQMGPADWLREDDQQVLKTLGIRTRSSEESRNCRWGRRPSTTARTRSVIGIGTAVACGRSRRFRTRPCQA